MLATKVQLTTVAVLADPTKTPPPPSVAELPSNEQSVTVP
jgi:hypothetical protein